MKKTALLTLALVCLCGKSFAQDLVFNMTEDSGVTIVSGGVFDPTNMCVGNTDAGTTICLGDVDFGDGNKYAGVSILQANESNMTGFVDIYQGNPDEGGVLINDLECHGTGGWQHYTTYRYNFYPEGSDVPRPKGKQTVYVRYRDGGEGVKYFCNLKRITFYTQELSEDEMGLMPAPVYNYKEYLAASQMQFVDDKGSAHLGDEGQIGWTESGVTVLVKDADFGTGSYGQIAVNLAHQGTDVKCRLLVYVDAVKDENLIANIWAGRDFSPSWSVYDYVADDIIKTVSGKHDVYIVWEKPSNIKSLRLCEGHPYEVEYGHEYIENKDKEPKPEVITLTEAAYTMTFDSMGGVENSTDILVKGSANARYESANIGYTSKGVLVRFNDVDFKNGDFQRIVVESSTDQSALGNSSFDFYLDLPADVDFSDMSHFADYPMLATVKAPATGSWSEHALAAGALTDKVTGVHALYMLWNVTNGCNVFAVSLDHNQSAGINTIEQTSRPSALYNISGQHVDQNFKGIVISNGKKVLVK